MKLYWKNFPLVRRYELFAEPAARCLHIEFCDGEWIVACLGSKTTFPGNVTMEGVKILALEWLEEIAKDVGRAAEALRKS